MKEVAIQSSTKLRTITLLVFLYLFSFTFELRAEDLHQKTIKIAAIDWCPQLCIEQPVKGYVYDIVEKVYQRANYKLVIDYFPWSRAIKLVRNGSYDALLSPAKKEAPDLIYPTTPVGVQQMCFFVGSRSQWRYEDIRSLAGLRIGMATDVSIEELNTFMHSNLAQFQFQPYNDRYVEQSVKKVLKKRVDTFLFTKNTTLFELRRLGLEKQIQEVGCVSKANIYIAFSPIKKNQHHVAQLINVYEAQMASILNSGSLHEILKKYGIEELPLE